MGSSFRLLMLLLRRLICRKRLNLKSIKSWPFFLDYSTPTGHKLCRSTRQLRPKPNHQTSGAVETNKSKNPYETIAGHNPSSRADWYRICDRGYARESYKIGRSVFAGRTGSRTALRHDRQDCCHSARGESRYLCVCNEKAPGRKCNCRRGETSADKIFYGR